MLGEPDAMAEEPSQQGGSAADNAGQDGLPRRPSGGYAYRLIANSRTGFRMRDLYLLVHDDLQ
jgi:hypothetical protein